MDPDHSALFEDMGMLDILYFQIGLYQMQNFLDGIIIVFNFVTYTIIQSITSSGMCSLHLTHPSAHTLGAVDGHTHTHTHTHTPGAVGS